MGVQLKREAKLLTVIGLNTKHADCRINVGNFFWTDQKNQPYLHFLFILFYFIYFFLEFIY